MILLIDSYDSFTYNLLDLFYQLKQDVKLITNDQCSLSQIEALRPNAIVLSPGPGHPKQAGCLLQVIHHFFNKVPILGICLGHQAIATACGAEVVPNTVPVHGKTELISHDGQTLFQTLPNPFSAMRYHSLVVDPLTLPDSLQISAYTADGVVMGLRHRHFALEGVQFHPESILTQDGIQLINNFINIYC